MTPLQITMVVAWGCVLAGMLAVFIVLRGLLGLSERRDAFASAVTHELRTPLTTFQMYTEMLREGMVDEERKAQYLETLGEEADRLGHLVENVLAYAGLEKGRDPVDFRPLSVSDLMASVQRRLSQRAEDSGVELQVDVAPTVGNLLVETDVAGVERILFNLVDNACKYASKGPLQNKSNAAALECPSYSAAGPKVIEPRIRLQVERARRFVLFRVEDNGPGVPVGRRGKLFKPFTKSARDSAHSAPGVGLGLALSRSLACRMGGNLRLDRTGFNGAAFVLSLPLVRNGPARHE